MESEPKSRTMKRTPNVQLGAGIPASNPAHDPGADFSGNDVGHGFIQPSMSGSITRKAANSPSNFRDPIPMTAREPRCMGK
jgi:hypothetical protein